MNQIKYYSIGCDCHPAYVLTYLKLRHKAGPFDHIDTKSIESAEYFLKLTNSSFLNFLDDLLINNNGKVISKHYPQTEFCHDNDLITNKESKHKYERRINRFMDDYKHSKCVFLLNIKYDTIKNKNDVIKLIGDIDNILNEHYFIKNDHILYLYLRYDENLDENKILCDLFINEISTKFKYSKNFVFKKYCRYKNKFGIWGNPLEYSNIFSDLFKFEI